MNETTAKTFRLGLIGCGFFAQNHLAAWSSIPNVRLVAVCDLDEAKARAAAKDFSVPAVYTDAAAMLDSEDLDFVDIATTMPSHKPLVELAAARRLPLIVQKPLAPTWEDCKAIVATCAAAGIPMMVHENTRFKTSIRAVRRVIDSGAIGVPTWARIHFRTGHDIYAKQPYLAREEKFVILDLGVHMLDVARFLVGEAGSLYCRTNSVKPGIRGEDVGTIMLGHDNGATSVVECSYASPQDPDPFPQVLVQVEGRRGSIRLDPGYRMTVVSDGKTERSDVSPGIYPWSTPPWHSAQESVLRTQQHWVDCLACGVTPETAGADSLKTYGLVFGAYVSARTGQALAPLT